MKSNFRAVVKAMTFRRGGIVQHATIGRDHRWYTDDMLQLPMIESDRYNGLAMAGIDVEEVRAPLGGLSTSPTRRSTRGARSSKIGLDCTVPTSPESCARTSTEARPSSSVTRCPTSS